MIMSNLTSLPSKTSINVSLSLLHCQRRKCQLHSIRASNFQIAIGDIVCSIVNAPSSKLKNRFDSPFRVIAEEDGNKVKLLNLSDSTERFAHLDQLKRIPRDLDIDVSLPTSAEALVPLPPHYPYSLSSRM